MKKAKTKKIESNPKVKILKNESLNSVKGGHTGVDVTGDRPIDNSNIKQ